MKRILALAFAALFMLGLLAGPAAARTKVAVIQGTAKVSKVDVFNYGGPGACTDGTPAGGGLGLPVIHGLKNGYWFLSTALRTSNSPAGTTGSLVACGRLNKAFSAVNGGVGAACGMSKGTNGRGTVMDTAKSGASVTLRNLEWKFTVGGSLPITGDADFVGGGNKNGRRGVVLALVNAQGGIPCPMKDTSTSPKSGGATEFTVNGVAAIVQTSLNGLPLFCKKGLAGNCLYDPKK